MVPAALLLAIALVTLYVARSVRTFFALRHFGGHWSAGWSRIWLLRTQSSGEMNKRFTEINDKYGSTARVGPLVLVTTDPDLFRRMNAVRSPFTRGPFYAALKLHPEHENIVSVRDERKHNELRTRMASGYAGKENPHLEQDIDEQLLKFFDLIDSKYVARPQEGCFRTVDISRVTSFFTLDVISKIAFGQPFGFLVNDEDPFGYLKNLEDFLPAIIVFGVYTELTKILKMPLLKAALPKSTDKRGLGRVMGFARDRVQERFGHKAIVRQDMLGSFINHGLTQGELESETIIQITAGSDSTASSLRLTLHFICTSPPILKRLLAEIDAAIAAGRISRPVIRDTEARQLPYLQACIKEGLRMYPPVTGQMAKLVPAGGVNIDVDGVEKYIPGGTQIAWNSWGMMRHQDIFGPDCEIYRPERWLPKDRSEQEQSRIARMTDTVGLCFGYGRFGCLGRGVALMELNKALIETLLRYNLQPCSLSKPFNEMVVGFYVHTDMNFVITERREDNAKADAQDRDNHGFHAAALPGVEDVTSAGE
ncbi:hypothetical protein LTR37_012028 [Vermiconidia calcicola]|uniref:Uncharacterized protein n=1 Tax=Vermiconidia calcicola TaxID=1690605 RepID=A0ACC3N1F9_9PEZI|nr:hypothetical protein LTR37_012028 [Vermiconidia calcicola]